MPNIGVAAAVQVTNSALLPRLAHWEQDGCACGLRHGRRLVPGIMDAPLGRVTFVCVGVVGLPVLRAWDAACAAESLSLWEASVLDVAAAWDGHPAAMSDGVALVAFQEPVSGPAPPSCLAPARAWTQTGKNPAFSKPDHALFAASCGITNASSGRARPVCTCPAVPPNRSHAAAS